MNRPPASRLALLLPMLCLAACMNTAAPPPPEPLPEGEQIVRGEVIEVDGEPMTYDGNGIIRVRADGGAEVRVLVAARMNLCEAEGLSLFGELMPGERIEARGRTVDGGVMPCDSDTHYLRRP